jgi:amidase
MNAGATLRGKTVTDEISLGLLGINKFYGTPFNPRAPDCVPGGSSSGSASAVAGGLVDVALGTDSGGSVRIPASFCGLFGLRPTHGRISTEGMMTQAPSFDTVGYFTDSAASFGRVGSVLLGEQVVDALPDEIIVASDCFALADEPVRHALLPALDRLRRVVRTSESLLADGDLTDWARHQRVLQQSEFHATFRDWIDRVNPRFSAEVAGAFADDGRIAASDVAAANAFRKHAVPADLADPADSSQRAPVRDARSRAPDRRSDLHRRTDGLSAGEPADGCERRDPGRPVSHRLARR